MLVDCHECSTLFNKTPYEMKKSKSGNHFCSKTCSARHNNKHHIKRRAKQRKCVKCSSIYTHSYKDKDKHTSTMCQTCKKENSPTEKAKNTTLKDIRESLAVKGKHPSWTHARVRINNRNWNKHLTTYGCQVCGYTTHVELCHIKSVTEFDETATLAEVNDPSNILVLCRNHHWELDNNVLDKNNIQPRG